MFTQITVFTATYNREKLLKRLFDSLIKQSDKSFEWIIVDDDSSDDTERLITELSEIAPFDIMYIKQSHGGKHRAINKGLDFANGEWFYIVDSDDFLKEDTISTIKKWIDGINLDNGKYAAVSGNCQTPDGKLIGEFPNTEYIDSNNLDRMKNGLNGDKSEVYRTEILRKYKFPEIDGEFFFTERYIWDKIANDGYLIRWHNKSICVCEYLEDGLTKQGANQLKGHVENIKGYSMYVEQSMRLWDRIEAVTIFREYNKVCKTMGTKISSRGKAINLKTSTYIKWLLLIMPMYYVLRICKRFYVKRSLENE